MVLSRRSSRSGEHIPGEPSNDALLRTGQRFGPLNDGARLRKRIVGQRDRESLLPQMFLQAFERSGDLALSLSRQINRTAQQQ